MKKDRISLSPDETLAIGIELGTNAKKGDIFGLMGGLGSGKTVLAKGIAKGLGVADEITSPTFTLLEIYAGRLALYHFDLYRIEGGAELDALFFEEYWFGDGVSVIEWAEKAGARLGDGITTVRIEYVDENTRRITAEYPDH